MTGPTARMLPDGKRLHLQHGPIDLVIGAEGPGRNRAYDAAVQRFENLLAELVDELPQLKKPPVFPGPVGNVARAMFRAVQPHSSSGFVTPMAAVAGAVADAVLAAMVGQAQLSRAYVNNGGDIALHLTPDTCYRLAMAGLENGDLGRIRIGYEDDLRGVATSGFGGRSLSMGIATSVTVLARNAATADVAATLIANAVDLPGHRAVTRKPACDVNPDSDLGQRLVVTGCGPLQPTEIDAALGKGAQIALAMQAGGLIHSAALFLDGKSKTVGMPTALYSGKQIENA